MDFLSANEAKLERIPDPDVLAIAAEQNRILVTHDRQTMPLHFGEFLMAERSGPGVFLVNQHTPIGEVIDALVLIWAASDADEWKNRIVNIPEWRLGSMAPAKPSEPAAARSASSKSSGRVSIAVGHPGGATAISQRQCATSTGPHYSLRNATTGSILVTRRAGSQQASAATPSSQAPTATNVGGSSGRT